MSNSPDLPESFEGLGVAIVVTEVNTGATRAKACRIATVNAVLCGIIGALCAAVLWAIAQRGA